MEKFGTKQAEFIKEIMWNFISPESRIKIDGNPLKKYYHVMLGANLIGKYRYISCFTRKFTRLIHPCLCAR